MAGLKQECIRPAAPRIAGGGPSPAWPHYVEHYRPRAGLNRRIGYIDARARQQLYGLEAVIFGRARCESWEEAATRQLARRAAREVA